MKNWIIKAIVVLPVTIVACFYLPVLYHEQYTSSSFKRITGFILSIVLLFAWIIYITIRKRQGSLPEVVIQSSFFVYVFSVLQLTGYFILFREISSHGWWEDMDHRVKTHDHVNFVPFKTIGIYDTFDRQIAGNFIMLLPLGIYLPLLYRRLRKLAGFFIVLLVSLIVSIAIEILQLATNYRSTDIDDVILNTAGACVGFLFYLMIKTMVNAGKN